MKLKFKDIAISEDKVMQELLLQAHVNSITLTAISKMQMYLLVKLEKQSLDKKAAEKVSKEIHNKFMRESLNEFLVSNSDIELDLES